MNAISSRPLPARPLALPNLLTYARIAAVPVVVGLLYWQSIFDGPLSLRWIALVLALSFGFYGLMRKTAQLGALEGLTLETLILSPFAAGALIYWTVQGSSAFASGDAGQAAWLLLAGPLTAIPLLLFAAGARRITLTTLGLVKYLSPTIQFLLGVWLYHEPLAGARLVGFVLIWSALAVYSAESLWRSRR